MTERISSHNSIYSSCSSVHQMIRRFNILGTVNDSSSVSAQLKHSAYSLSSVSLTGKSRMSKCGLSPNEIGQEKKSSNDTLIIPKLSTASTHVQSNQKQYRVSNLSNSSINKKNMEPRSSSIYTLPTIIYKELQSPINNNQSESSHKNFDDIELGIIETIDTRKQIIDNHDSIQYPTSTIDDYEVNDIQRQSIYLSSPSGQPPPPPPPVFALPYVQQESTYQPKRTLQLSNFLLEIGILITIFILCMVLVLAIREDQVNLRITMQVVYTYIYLVSIVWMIWCTVDIIKFRQQWMKLTSSVHDQEEYMDIVERYPHRISYFPDMHNTSGLFMRIGAGLLCMGSLILNIIQLAKTIEVIRTGSRQNELLLINYSKSVFLIKLITVIFRFLFHCVQFMFLFRYGNIVIDRYHLMAKVGLIHIIIANFCTWFEAIVIETLDELRKHSVSIKSINIPMIFNTTKTIQAIASKSVGGSFSNISHNTTTSTLEIIEKIESSMSVYLYPCFIEYSLICVTVFYIMWRNVGKTEQRSFLHFGDRHIFTVDCSRASRGLLLGGIIFILAILTLIPAYILNTMLTILITHITKLVLLVASLLIVCISFFYTTKLYYDRQAHVDVFDQILILVTTVGDFAYSFFGLFASIFIESYRIQLPRFVEIVIGLLSILQTYLQSGFILDTLRRRSITKSEIRKKPGRELITALLLINLAIWMHDSLSANKVKLNPIQTEYYNSRTWSLVQAFTSPLSIFYRFHSSVCLADIWQEVYHDQRNYHGKNQRFERQNKSDRLTKMNNIHHNQY
ncbi:unnamed protein product [Rotaria sp. Silwood2]|nr:unnamed protein product [Rotaria sp. Silwood2]CAF2611514.1 unnamed protein product [Rotaria sp. Silwood2]CAF2872762.1 unnamed protein product [Rotaria sp. Silwood2]CAF4235587.1 unnamed protein product [Rotaria sp. Silwood2]CAF4250960.1 unnamed protein product [Rotaria sp. Silwood2]